MTQQSVAGMDSQKHGYVKKEKSHQSKIKNDHLLRFQ